MVRNAIVGAAAMLLAAGTAHAQTAPGPPETSAGKPSFTFHSTLWVNLHHFLYVLGRARSDTQDSHRAAVVNAPADTQGFESLCATERETWDRAIACYQKDVSPMNAIFDQDLIAMTNALAAAGDASSLAGAKIPAGVRAVLEDAAPVYRKVWWERHSRLNRARTEELQALPGALRPADLGDAHQGVPADLAARRADRTDVRLCQLGGCLLDRRAPHRDGQHARRHGWQRRPRNRLPRSHAPVGRCHDPAAPGRRPTSARGHSPRPVSLPHLLHRRLRHLARSSRPSPVRRPALGVCGPPCWCCSAPSAWCC